MNIDAYVCVILNLGKAMVNIFKYKFEKYKYIQNTTFNPCLKPSVSCNLTLISEKFVFSCMLLHVFFAVIVLFSFKALLHLVVSSNVDVKNSLTFSGPLEDMFGYTVQQYENEEGKW